MDFTRYKSIFIDKNEGEIIELEKHVERTISENRKGVPLNFSIVKRDRFAELLITPALSLSVKENVIDKESTDLIAGR